MLLNYKAARECLSQDSCALFCTLLVYHYSMLAHLQSQIEEILW